MKLAVRRLRTSPALTRTDNGRVREVAEHVAIGGIGPVLVGSPATVADQLEAWIDETDLDGFNLAFVVRPETFVDVMNMVVPELQRRGRYKTAYSQERSDRSCLATRALANAIRRRVIDGSDVRIK